MPFRFLEHTADVRVECRAPTFPALLETAAQALYDLALRRVETGKDSERRIEVSADTDVDVLVRWLQELLFLLDVDHFVATEFSFADAKEPPAQNRHAAATLRGYIHRPDARAVEIKAATYHGAEIVETDDGLVAHIILDL